MKKLLLLPILALLSMSASAQTGLITGYINYDSLGLTSPDTFKVWLITYNQGTTTLAAVDSTGGYGWGHVYYAFQGKPAGTYMVKAQKINQTPGVAGLMPTYHDSSLYWNTAQSFTHTTTTNTFAHIWMKTGIVPTGPGFIGGNVSLGANKGASGGVAGMAIFLRNASNNAILSTFTNANGDYSFSGVPIGTYSVYPEAMNYATTPATSLVVSSGSTQVTQVNFNQDVNLHNIKPRSLEIPAVGKAENTLNIYPNPARKSVNVSWNNANANSAHIIITNATGQIVIDEAITNTASGFKAINISILTPGIYFLQGTQGLKAASQKLVVE